MGYDIELKNIELLLYKEMLKRQKLMVNRRMLKENIDEVFEKFLEYGIKNIYELYENIKDLQKAEELSDKTKIAMAYLIVLLKEISGLFQKPVLIADFPYITPYTFKKLGEACIQTSKDFYELSDGGREVDRVCKETGITKEAAEELCSLCDLIRINGVGPVFSRVLFEAGYRYVREIAVTDAKSILNRVIEVNTDKNFTRVLLDEDQLQWCIDFAKLIS